MSDRGDPDAGWRHFPTVSTVEELDALPFGAIVMSPNGQIHKHISTPRARFPWRSIDGHTRSTQRLAALGFPCIVLNTP